MKEVIVVAADLARLNADTGVIKRLHGWKALGKEPGLHLAGNLHLMGRPPGRFPPFFLRAALRLHRLGHLVNADQHKTVAIKVFKSRKDAAPDRRLAAAQQSRRLFVMQVLILHPAEARRMLKTDPALS